MNPSPKFNRGDTVFHTCQATGKGRRSKFQSKARRVTATIVSMQWVEGQNGNSGMYRYVVEWVRDDGTVVQDRDVPEDELEPVEPATVNAAMLAAQAPAPPFVRSSNTAQQQPSSATSVFGGGLNTTASSGAAASAAAQQQQPSSATSVFGGGLNTNASSGAAAQQQQPSSATSVFGGGLTGAAATNRAAGMPPLRAAQAPAPPFVRSTNTAQQHPSATSVFGTGSNAPSGFGAATTRAAGAPPFGTVQAPSPDLATTQQQQPSSATGTPSQGQIRTTREILESLYREVNSEKGEEEIDGILTKYAGREDMLFSKLSARYGEERLRAHGYRPSSDVPPSSSFGGGATSTTVTSNGTTTNATQARPASFSVSAPSSGFVGPSPAPSSSVFSPASRDATGPTLASGGTGASNAHGFGNTVAPDTGGSASFAGTAPVAQAPALAFASSVQQQQQQRSANIFGSGSNTAAGFGAAATNHTADPSFGAARAQPSAPIFGTANNGTFNTSAVNPQVPAPPVAQQEQEDFSVAQQVANQDPFEVILEHGGVEAVLQEGNHLHEAYISAIFQVFSEMFGGRVLVDRNGWNDLRHQDLRQAVLSRLEENTDVHIILTAYTNATNEAGLGHWGAAVRFKAPGGDPANPSFRWHYVDTWNGPHEGDREGRRSLAREYLNSYGILGDDGELVSIQAFFQEEGECAAAMAYLVVGIVLRYLNGQPIETNLQFNGTYTSRLVRTWMYQVLRTRDAIPPSTNWGEMERIIMLREVIAAIYRDVNPSIVGRVDGIISDVSGQEDELLTMMVDWYDVEPQDYGIGGLFKYKGKTAREMLTLFATKLKFEENNDTLSDEINGILRDYRNNLDEAFNQVAKCHDINPSVFYGTESPDDDPSGDESPDDGPSSGASKVGANGKTGSVPPSSHSENVSERETVTEPERLNRHLVGAGAILRRVQGRDGPVAVQNMVDNLPMSTLFTFKEFSNVFSHVIAGRGGAGGTVITGASHGSQMSITLQGGDYDAYPAGCHIDDAECDNLAHISFGFRSIESLEEIRGDMPMHTIMAGLEMLSGFHFHLTSRYMRVMNANRLFPQNHPIRFTDVTFWGNDEEEQRQNIHRYLRVMFYSLRQDIDGIDTEFGERLRQRFRLDA